MYYYVYTKYNYYTVDTCADVYFFSRLFCFWAELVGREIIYDFNLDDARQTRRRWGNKITFYVHLYIYSQNRENIPTRVFTFRIKTVSHV